MKLKMIFYAVTILGFVSCQNANTDAEKETTNAETVEATTPAEEVKIEEPVSEDYAKETTNEETAKKIQSFLQEKNKDDIEKNVLTENDRKFSFYEIDLNDDGNNEYFISLQGSYFCGSGGCSFYLLNNDMSVNTYFSVTSPPVFRSFGKTNGWHDLILFGDYQDGGVKNYIHLKYDKTKGKYPSNPSLVKKIDMAPSGSDFAMWHDEFSKAKPFTF